MDIFGVVSRYLRNAVVMYDGAPAKPRLDRRGEIYAVSLWQNLQALAEEGSLFVASTVPGTGVTATAATGTVYSATQGLLTIANLETVPVALGGKRVLPVAVRLTVTAAGTASTSLHIAHSTDTIVRGSGGTPGVMGGKNVNTGEVNDAIAEVRFGVPTIAAASANARILGRSVLRNQIPVVNDVYVIVFGAVDQPSGGVNLAQANAAVISAPAPAITLDPGHSYTMHEWSVARSAAQSMEAEVMYAVR